MRKYTAIIMLFLLSFQTIGGYFANTYVPVMAAEAILPAGLNVLLENQKIAEVTPPEISRVLTQLKTWMEDDADTDQGTNLGGVLYWNFEESGNYTLEYPLENNRKVTFDLEFQGNEVITSTYKLVQGSTILQEGIINGADYFDGVVLQGGKQQRINFHVDNENKMVYVAMQNGLNIGEVYPVQLSFVRSGDSGSDPDPDRKFLMTGIEVLSRPTDWEWKNNKYQNKTNIFYEDPNENPDSLPGAHPGFQLYFNHPKLVTIEGDTEWSGVQDIAQNILDNQMILQYDSEGDGLFGGSPLQVGLKGAVIPGGATGNLVEDDNDYGLNPEINGEKADYSINIVKDDNASYPGGDHEELFTIPRNQDKLLPGTAYDDVVANLKFTEADTKQQFIFGEVLLQTPSTYLKYEIRNIINWGYVLRIPPDAPYYVDGEFYMKRSEEQDTWYYYEGEPEAQQWKPQVTVDPTIDYNFIDPAINKKNAIYVRFEPYDEQKTMIYSQIYIFHTNDIEALPEYTPTNIRVSSVNVVPQLFPRSTPDAESLDLENEAPQEVDFKLSWDIPMEGLKKKKEMDYFVKLLNNYYDTNPYIIKKYSVVYDETTEQIDLYSYTSDSDKHNPSNLVSSYEIDSDQFQVDIPLVRDGEGISYIPQDEEEAPPTIHKSHYIRIEAIDGDEGNFPSTSQPIVLENQYFPLQRKNIHIPGPDSIELDYSEEDETVQASSLENIEISIKDRIYGGRYDDLLKKLGDNRENPLDPTEYYTKAYPLEYEVYISADKRYLEQLGEDEQLLYEGTLSDPEISLYPQDNDIQDSVDPALVEDGVYEVQDSDYLHDTSTKAVLKLKVKSTIEEGDIDPNEEDPISEVIPLRIEGLQPNVPYYVMVRTVFNVKYKTAQEQEEVFYTDLTTIHSIRTGTEEQPPTSSEKVPSRPEQPRVVTKDEDSSVYLEWEYLSKDQENIGFDVLRLPRKSLDELNDLQILDVVEVLDHESFSDMEDQVQMWRSDITSGNIEYNQDKEEGGWEDYGRELLPTSVEDPEEGVTLHFEDYLIKGNNLYYYYIRTTRTDPEDGEVSAVSPWIGVPVTTPGLPGPTLYDLPELRGEDVEYDDGDEEYIDPYKEALICFDIPFNHESGNYDFEVFVKGEEDGEFILADGEEEYDAEEVEYSDDISIPIDTDVTTRYFYRVTGLTHGTAYDIKVRMIDLDQVIETEPETIYAYSHDSNVISIRTEFDQDEYDEEEEEDRRVEDFDKKIEDYLKNHYWELEYDLTEVYSVKLRGEYVESDIAAHGKRAYELVVNDTHNQFQYYIPWENIRYTNQNDVSFIIERNNTKVTIRPDTFDDQWLIEQISKEERERYGGYYVLLKVDFYEGVEDGIQMNPNQSGVTIGFDLYGSRYSDKELELRWIEKLYEDDGLIDQAKRRFARRIKNLRENDQELVKQWMDKEFEYFKEDLADYLKRDMDSRRITQKLASLNQVQLPVMIQMKTNASTGYMKGYRYTSELQIIPIELNQMGDQVMVNVKDMDTYLFDKAVTPSYSYNGTVNKMITQYDLTNLLGYNHQPQDQVTYGLIYQVLAKVTGMPTGQEAQQWLRQKGILLSNGTRTLVGIEKGEAVEQLMKLYEYKNRINSESHMISNYGAIADLNEVSNNKRRTLLTAYELGLIEVDEESKYHPKEKLTIEELLNTLSKIIM